MDRPPQDDPAQVVKNLQIQSPYTHRTVTDSEGNKLLYIEARNLSQREWNVIETFRLTRRETGVDSAASATRPLTPQEAASMRHYLEPNKYVVIDDTIRQLANEIAGNERNPIVAMSKINEWMIDHVDYYAKAASGLKSDSNCGFKNYFETAYRRSSIGSRES